MPIIDTPAGTLEVTNAILSASEFRATQKISVSNSAPTKNFSVGDKFHVSTTDADAVNITGNLVAHTLKIGNLLVSPTFDLAAVSNVGNTTSNTLQFANATTGFVTSSNVEIGGNITLTSNAQVKVGSNVLAEYTGPHGRDPKEMPLKKYPEIAFEKGKFDYNTTTNTFTQAGYTITSSSNYGGDDVNSLFTAWRSFTGLTNGYGPGWTSGGGGAGHPSAYTNGVANSNQSLTNIDTATSTDNVSSRNGAWVKLELPKKIKLSRVDFYDRYDNINIIGGNQERVSEAFVYGGNNNSGPWYEIGKQSEATNMAHYTDDNPASLTINTTSYYKYYIIQPTAQENLTRVYVSYGQLMFYGTEEPAPPGDLSLDTTLKSTFNSVRSNNYVMYFDGDGFIPGDTNSNNLVENSSTSVIHHNATYDSTGKYWTLDGSTESNVTTGSLGFEGDVPHTVSMWVNSSNLDANATTQQLFSIGSGYDKAFLKVDDTQIAANTWHNVTYAYQGEGGSKVTYVDGRKVEEAQVEDTFGDYPPFAMTDYETGGYRVSASSEHTSGVYPPWKLFDTILTNPNVSFETLGGRYDTTGAPYEHTAGVSTTVSGTPYTGDWVQMYFPFKFKVDHIDLMPQDTYGLERMPQTAIIAGSDDNVNWTLLKSITTDDHALTKYTNYIVSATRAYKYIRFIWNTLTTAGGNAAYKGRIAGQEMRFYGHKEGDLTRFPEPTRVLKYPHIAMTGPAQRGYVVEASHQYATSGDDGAAYNVFNTKENTWWGGYEAGDAARYTSPNFTYTGGGDSVSLGDTGISGEYIVLKLPYKITLSSLKLIVDDNINYAILHYTIVGSNNGTNWFTIKDVSGLTTSDYTASDPHTTTTDIVSSTAYSQIGLIVRQTSAATQTAIEQIQYYGTQEDTGTPTIVGGPFAGKVANFRVYDQYLGDERIQEIYDVQKDAFGHKKSSMTFYKGRVGVGTTEPEGALTVIDEPHALAKFPMRAVSADDSYVEGDGQIKLSAANGSGYRAFDGLTSTSWNSTPIRNTRVSEEVDFGAWLKIQTQESVSLKKAEIESNPYWRQVGSEVQGSSSGNQFGRAVACSHDGTRVIVGGYPYNSSQGMVRVYDWNGSVWTQVGNTLTGNSASPADGQYGRAVAISGDGNIIAVAAPFEHVSSYADKGTVRVYYLNGNTWTILPDSGSLTGDLTSGFLDVFVGETAEDRLGLGGVKLSYDGYTVAMGEPKDDTGVANIGRIRVFTYSNGAWSQKGSTLIGNHTEEEFGQGLDMSEDGNHLIIGTKLQGGTSQPPRVEVYQWNGSAWTQKGSSLTYADTDDGFGRSLSISNDGNTIAIGIKNADAAEGAPADNAGVVYVYHWSGSAWGTPHKLVQPVTDDDDFGDHQVMSGDGKRIIVGASQADDGGTDSGRLYTFEYTGTSWVLREVPSIGADGGTNAYLGMGPSNSAHSHAISKDGSVIVAGESGYDGTAGADSGRFRVFSMPSNIKSIWGSNDDVNWTKITTAPTREGATSNVAGLAFGYDDRLEFKNLDNPNYYKYHVIVADAFTRLKDVKLFGVRKQGSSTLHDGTLTLTKNLDVPRIGPALDADDTPRRDRLVVEYNTSTNPVEDGAVRDTSGRGNDGVFVNQTHYDATEKALVFDGADDRILTRLQNPAGESLFSGSLWYKPTGAGGQEGFVWIGTHALGKAFIFKYNNPNFEFSFYGNDAIFNYTLNAGTWYHIAFAYSGGTASSGRRIWVNSGEIAYTSGASSTALNLDANAQLMIGDRTDNGADLYGAISNFKLYDCALTASEVKTLYDMGRCDEGGHVVNFNKTRVGIGLGDGEVPRGALDVRGVATINGLSLRGSQYAVGGTVSSVTVGGSSVTAVGIPGNYRVHTFTSSGTFTVDYPGLTADVLIIGGGGGGGNTHAGGGGGGGYLETRMFISGGVHNIVIGAGGAGSSAATSPGATGNPTHAFGIVAAGGGGGGSGWNTASGGFAAPTTGASGGAGSGEVSNTGGAIRQNYNTSSPGYSISVPGYNPYVHQFQGGNGGNGSNSALSGGGGGGAGGHGGNGSGSGAGVTNSYGGAGGLGISSSITGTPISRGGGGGGGAWSGTGGAGNGGGGNGQIVTSGGANTGGGGGGAGNDGNYFSGGSGGSGVVIIRYMV